MEVKHSGHVSENANLTAGKKKIWEQIKRLSSKLDTIFFQVDRISQAIDSFEMYSYHYNIKIVGIPQVAETQSSEDTTSICLKLFSCIGVVVSKTKHSKTKTEARSTQISKTKTPNLENEAMH